MVTTVNCALLNRELNRLCFKTESIEILDSYGCKSKLHQWSVVYFLDFISCPIGTGTLSFNCSLKDGFGGVDRGSATAKGRGSGVQDWSV